MSRRSARRNAFFLLFQMDFHAVEEYNQVKEIFFAEKEEPVVAEDEKFILSRAKANLPSLLLIDLVQALYSLI